MERLTDAKVPGPSLEERVLGLFRVLLHAGGGSGGLLARLLSGGGLVIERSSVLVFSKIGTEEGRRHVML